MYSIIVMPASGGACAGEQIRLAPGDRLLFGRAPVPDDRPGLTITHPGVSRTAGEITACGTYWALSNLSGTATYVVENPEGARRTHQLRPVWPGANRAAVQWNIDYLAVKLRLKPGPDTCDPGPRLNGKKETLVSLALRFDLVREDDLTALAVSATTGTLR